VVHADWGQEHRYRMKIKLGQEQEPQKTKIVLSTSGSKELPRSLPKAQTREGVREVCEITTILGPSSLRRKNQHWWQLRKEYNLAEFRVRLLVGAGLKFEILDKDGICVKAQKDVPVSWEPVVPRTMPEEVSSEMYPWKQGW